MKTLLTMLWSLCVIVGLMFVIIPEIFKMQDYSDKFMHVLFASLFILGPSLYFKNVKYTFGIAFCIFLSGIGLEIIQSMLPDRKAELLDVISNITGLSLGLIIGYLLKSGYNAGGKLT